MKESVMIIIKSKHMKTHYVWAGILCLMALSCNTNRLEPVETAGPVEMTFYADMGDNQDTKTVLQEDRMSIWWSPKDSIKIFFGKSS